MASLDKKSDVDNISNDIEASYDSKVSPSHLENDAPVEISPTNQSRPALQAPEFIRNMTPEERAIAEKKLKWKIDLRLLPMVVLMYIMNYLDRVSCISHLASRTYMLIVA